MWLTVSMIRVGTIETSHLHLTAQELLENSAFTVLVNQPISCIDTVLFSTLLKKIKIIKAGQKC